MLTLLAWRLGRGPIPLPFLTARLEQAFSRPESDAVARVGGAELAWSQGRPEIRVLDVALSRADGASIATFPQLSVWPSLRAAAHGELGIARVAVSGIKLALLRTADGRLTIGTREGSTNEQTVGLFASLIGDRSAKSTPTHLWRIEIYDAQVVLDDRGTQTEWLLEPADVVINLHARGFTARLASDVALRSETNPIVRELVLPLTATADVIIGQRGEVSEVAFEARGEEGRVITAADTKIPTALPALSTRGIYSAESASMEVNYFTATVGSAEIQATAYVPIAAGGVAQIDGRLASVPVADVTRFWPPASAHDVREWIMENIDGGVVPSGEFKLRVPYGEAAVGRLPDEAVNVTFAFEGMTVNYLRPMDPLHDVRGSGKVTGDRFDATVQKAALKNLAVSNGVLGIEFKRGIPDPALATIAVDVSGPTADMLALIDEPPLEMTRKLGITSDAAGKSDVHTDIELPLHKDVSERDVRITADADVRDAALANIVAGIGIENGDLRVHVEDKRFAIDGETGLTGAGGLGERAEISLTVDPDRDATGATELKGAIATPEVEAEGEVILDAGGLRSATLSALRFGRTDVSTEMTREVAGDYRVLVTGETLDLEPLIDRMGKDEEPTSLPDVEWALDVDISRVLTGRPLELVGVRGNCRGRAERLQTLHAVGNIADGGTVQLDVDTGGGTRRINVSSDEGGKLLLAVGINERVHGGRLSFSATMDDTEWTRRGEGELDLEDFRVVQAPLLAKILSLGSLDGLATLMGREGIGFTRARIPLAWLDGKIELRDASAVGGLGITADGTIDQNNDVLDIDGQVIPAYTLNSALGKVPLLGKLLVGGEGQGVFGFNYSVGGTRGEPKVSVNPISVLAPGVLRQMFIDPFSR